MPKQASLLGSVVPFDSPLEGHSLWDFASTTCGTARGRLFFLGLILLCFIFYFISLHFIDYVIDEMLFMGCLNRIDETCHGLCKTTCAGMLASSSIPHNARP